MPLQSSHTLKFESACCVGGGSFLVPKVAGSSPVALLSRA
jgi:hypothetical protein